MVFIDFNFKNKTERVYIRVGSLNSLLVNLLISICSKDSSVFYTGSQIKPIKKHLQLLEYEFPDLEIDNLFNEHDEDNRKTDESEITNNEDEILCLSIPLSDQEFEFSTFYDKRNSSATEIVEGLVSFDEEGRLRIYNEDQLKRFEYLSVGHVVSGINVIKEIVQVLNEGIDVTVKDSGIALKF